MIKYYLGADVGATKTHILIAEESGRAVGFGKSGSGNHESVGYEGLYSAIHTAADQAFGSTGLTKEQILGAGFGIAGYDWPSEREKTLEIIGSLGLQAPFQVVNDAILGVVAGAQDGWGVAVVSGTGCNCWGWDRTRKNIGQLTGGGSRMGEAAGASELVERAVQAIAYEWTGRGPATGLTPAILQYVHADDLVDLLGGLMDGRHRIDAAAAPIVFQVAAEGDPLALELIRWAGRELGELANTVIRQLHFEGLAFDVIQVGSMYDGSPLLTQTMARTIHRVAPGCRLVRLKAPSVVGAVLLGMEQAGLRPTSAVREQLKESATKASLQEDFSER
jgi:N-acetylglucosamine kinase-like BadF-type ATPase